MLEKPCLKAVTTVHVDGLTHTNAELSACIYQHLNHCGLRRHIATLVWVTIDSGNGLLPDGTNPLPESILTNHRRDHVPCTRGQFYGKCVRYIPLI